MMEYLNALLSWFDLHNEGIIALGVIIAALATVSAARVSAKSARKEQLGRLREEWVDELRDDLAGLMRIPLVVNGVSDADMREINLFSSRILLRLTSEKKSHEALSQAVEDFVQATVKGDSEELWGNNKKVVKAGRIVLKEAWKQAAGDLS